MRKQPYNKMSTSGGVRGHGEDVGFKKTFKNRRVRCFPCDKESETLGLDKWSSILPVSCKGLTVSWEMNLCGAIGPLRLIGFLADGVSGAKRSVESARPSA